MAKVRRIAHAAVLFVVGDLSVSIIDLGRRGAILVFRAQCSQETQAQEPEKGHLPPPFRLQVPQEENRQADAQEVH